MKIQSGKRKYSLFECIYLIFKSKNSNALLVLKVLQWDIVK